MNHLKYTSKEMFSSTELIRKSKMVFEKVQKREIEKAIILRDGKPSFMLLDFNTYEDVMAEYMALKEMFKEQTARNKKVISNHDIQKEEIKIIEEEISPKIEETVIQDIVQENIEEKVVEEINDLDLEQALAQIDDLDISLEELEKPVKNDLEINIDMGEALETNKEKEPLKDFWE